MSFVDVQDADDQTWKNQLRKSESIDVSTIMGSPSNHFLDSHELSILTINPSGKSMPFTGATPLLFKDYERSRQRNEKGDIASMDWLKEEYRASKRMQKMSEYSPDPRFDPSSIGLMRIHSIMGLIRRSILELSFKLQGWVLAIVIGLAAGLVTAFVKYTGDWIFYSRLGYCKLKPWLTLHQCCPDMVTNSCPNWIYWVQLLPNDAFGYENGVSFTLHILTSIILGIVAAFVTKFSGFARGSGLPELMTILNGGVIPKCLGFKTMFTKTIATAITIGSGFMIGIEESIGHILCCTTNVLSRVFPKYHHNEAKRREILGVAFSSAIAATLHSPLGSILFIYEGICTYFTMEMLLYSFIANIIAYNIHMYTYAAQPRVNIFSAWHHHSSWLWFEMLPFGAIAALSSLVGVGLKYFNTYIYKMRRISLLYQIPIIEASMIASITTVAIFWFPIFSLPLHRGLSVLLSHTCSRLSDSTIFPCNIFENPLSLLQFAVVPVIVFVLSAISFGSGVPSGIILPTLFIGSCIGFIGGILTKYLLQNYPSIWIFFECDDLDSCIHTNVYAIIGAISTLISTTGITVSPVVITVEALGYYNYLLPMSFCAMLARWVSQLFSDKSIYDMLISTCKYPYLDKKAVLNSKIYTEDIMTPLAALACIYTENFRVSNLRQLLSSTYFSGYPVLFPSYLILGYVSRSNLEHALQESTPHEDTLIAFAPEQIRRASGKRGNTFHCNDILNLSKYLESTFMTVSEYCPLSTLFNIFKSLGLKYIFVSRKGNLVGLITKKDLIQCIDKQHKRMKLHQNSSVGSFDESSSDEGDISYYNIRKF